MHALGQFLEIARGLLVIAAQRQLDGDQLDQQLDLDLGRAGAVQPVFVDLVVDQVQHMADPRLDLGIGPVGAERHADQGNGDQQRIHRVGGEHGAQFQRRDLGGERAGDLLHLFRRCPFDQDIVMTQPVEDPAGGQRRVPAVAAELALAADPVERQGAREAPLLVGAGIAEMPEPGKGLQVVLPVVMIDLERERRHTVGVDELGRQQIASLHHLEDGFAIGGAELGERAHQVVIARAGPGPADQRIGDDMISRGQQCAACEETQRMCQVYVLTYVWPAGSDRPARTTCQGPVTLS